MGFLFGFLMFICSYLMIGPILLGIYVIKYSNERQKIEEKTKALLIFVGLYIVVWIIALCVQTIFNHIVWVIVGAIVGAICSYITYDKNKKQFVINEDKHISFSQTSPRGTDALFDYIISLITKNGINHIDEEFEMPYMALIVRYFNKSKVESVINRLKPNLNIKFICEGTECGLLELVTETEKEEIFKLLVDEGIVYKNYNQVLLSLIDGQNYKSLKYLIEHRVIDFNIPISNNNLTILANLFEGQTVLDYAQANDAHKYIIDLIKQSGGKVSNNIEPTSEDEEIIAEQDVKEDINKKALTEIVEELKSSFINNAVGEVKEVSIRIMNVWNGREEVFSKAEIVQFAINLKSFKEQLSNEIYDKAVELYNAYQCAEYCIYQKHNLISLQYEIKLIQDEFEKLVNRKVTPSGDVV